MGLAPVLAQQMLHTLRRINREEGVTLLLVEQPPPRLEMADVVFVLGEGNLNFRGTPRELLEAGVVHSSYLGGTATENGDSEAATTTKAWCARQLASDATKSPLPPRSFGSSRSDANRLGSRCKNTYVHYWSSGKSRM